MVPIRKPHIPAFGNKFVPRWASNGTGKPWQKGEAGSSNVLGIGIIIFIIFVMLTQPNGGPGWSLSSGNSGATGDNRSLGEIWSGSIVGGTAISGGSSDSSAGVKTTGLLSIGTGNASYTYQPYEEYITLYNQSRSSVDITGWQLKNGKDKRPYYSGSTLQRFSADVAIIPQATRLLAPTGNSVMQDVVLKPDEQAVVTTGAVTNRSPFTVTSFKENMCTGYIEALPDYSFTPSLSRNCPSPSKEPGIENLERSCRELVESLSGCETPQIGERVNNEYCADCYRGKLLSSNCKAYLKEHFSYQGCLINHRNDQNFEGNTWRIFLGRGWEMWADKYESIELFDRFGQLVNYQNY